LKAALAIIALLPSLLIGAVIDLGYIGDVTWAGTGPIRYDADRGTADVTDGLLARWLMAEGTGTTAADTASTNTAYFVDGPAWTNRAAGRGGLYFDGANDALRSATLNLSSTNQITLTFWMNWKTYANDNDLAFEYSATMNSAPAFYINPNSGAPAAGKMTAVMSSGSGQYNGVAVDRPASNTWYHFTVVLNRASGVTCYKNGVLCASTPAYTNTLTGNFSGLAIGLNMMSRNGASLFGNGALQDVRIYNRVLSSNEAYTIWNATK
jgi:hypothetical protein